VGPQNKPACPGHEEPPWLTGINRNRSLGGNLLQPDISARIVRNSIANLLRGVISLPIVLLITPFIISTIGTTAFGIWALASAFVSYASLLDLGIGSALVKFVAQYKVKGETTQINYLLNTAFVTYIFVGALAFSLLLLSKEWILTQFFRVGGELRNEANFVLVGSMAIFTVNLAFGVFSSLLNGLQRMDLTSGTTITTTIVNAVGTIVVLVFGYGLKGLVVVSAMAFIAQIILNIVLSRREFSLLVFNPSLFRPSFLKRLLGFSLQMQVVGLASLVHAQLDKILLGHFLGLGYIAQYEAASRVVTHLRALPLMMLAPIMPAASEIHVDRDAKQVLQNLYYRSLKYMISVSLPIFVFVTLFAQSLISLWLGSDYSLAAFALQFLAMANLVNLLTGPGFLTLVGAGKPRYGVYSSLLGIALNIILSLTFIIWLGYTGAVWGTSLSLVLASVYFIIVFHKVQNISWQEATGRALISPALACLIAAGVSLLVSLHVRANVQGMAVVSVTFAASYLFALTKLPFWDAYDVSQIKRYIPQAMKER